MNIFLVIALAMLLIISLLRRHIPIGPAILAGGLLIWLSSPSVPLSVSAFTTTLTMQRTYDLILALYFVMCLEIELRTSGALDGMIRALQRLFASEKFTLAIMPAFLGLLLRWAAHVFLRPSSKQPAAIQTLPKNIKPPSISGSGISLNFPVPSSPA